MCFIIESWFSEHIHTHFSLSSVTSQTLEVCSVTTISQKCLSQRLRDMHTAHIHTTTLQFTTVTIFHDCDFNIKKCSTSTLESYKVTLLYFITQCDLIATLSHNMTLSLITTIIFLLIMSLYLCVNCKIAALFVCIALYISQYD